jgi:hypothetical protein
VGGLHTGLAATAVICLPFCRLRRALFFVALSLSVCQSVCLPICALTLPHRNFGITDAACACGEVGVGGAVLCVQCGGQAVW